jgi:hypothetical protein
LAKWLEKMSLDQMSLEKNVLTRNTQAKLKGKKN